MATLEEQKELVEQLKGPHYYKITVNGYGGESVFAKISKEAKDFWYEVTDEHGDADLVAYSVGAQDWTAEEIQSGASDIEFDYINPSDIPKEAMFLHDLDDEEATGSPWFEALTEVYHNHNVGYDSAYMYIEKVDSMEYSAKHIEDVIDGEAIHEFVERVGEATEWEVEPQISISETLDYNGEPREWEHMDKGDHVFQFESAEKGCFFEGYFETPGLFDEKKLRIIVDEDAAGNDRIWGFTYNGVEIDNNGGDTNGKGYYAWVWTQEH
jgi:hypothetical protein